MSRADTPEAAAGPFELLRARYVIESECAALAAKSAKRAQLAAIEDALDEMDREMEAGRQPLPGDRLFHLRVAEATGNGELFTRLEHHYDSPDLWRSAMSEHRAVLKSIVAHDARAARTAMQRHLNQAYKRFSKDWNARTS